MKLHTRRHDPKKITTAMLRELREIRFENNHLLGMLDNAAQTAYATLLPSYPDSREALRGLSLDAGKELSDGEIAPVMSKMFSIHNGILAPVSYNVKHAVPAEDFHRFYSLAYHIVPEGDVMHGKESIARVFEAFHLPPPLSREEVVKNLTDIIAGPDLAKELKKLSPVLSSGFDNPAQTVGMGFGAMGKMFEVSEIKEKLIDFLTAAGDGVSPENVSRRAAQLWQKHQNVQLLQRGDPKAKPVSREEIQQYYSLVSHLLPESDEKGRAGIEAFFEALNITHPGTKDAAVLSRVEVTDALPAMLDIQTKRGRPGIS